MESSGLTKIKYDIDKATNGIFLRKVDDGVSAMARHQGNHDGYTQVIKDALDKIDINQSTDVITKQIEEIQKIARNGLENGYPVRPLDMDSIGAQQVILKFTLFGPRFSIKVDGDERNICN